MGGGSLSRVALQYNTRRRCSETERPNRAADWDRLKDKSRRRVIVLSPLVRGPLVHGSLARRRLRRGPLPSAHIGPGPSQSSPDRVSIRPTTARTPHFAHGSSSAAVLRRLLYAVCSPRGPRRAQAVGSVCAASRQSRRRCGKVSPVAAQMWQRRAQSPAQIWQTTSASARRFFAADVSAGSRSSPGSYPGSSTM